MNEARYTPSRTAAQVLRARYLLTDDTGKVVETPEEMFWRVASHVASAGATFSRNVSTMALICSIFSSALFSSPKNLARSRVSMGLPS